MGCCSSKQQDVEQNEIPVSQIRTENNVTQQVPPIVITKAQSVSSVQSLRASTSANAISNEEHSKVAEKSPVISEAQNQSEELPSFEQQAVTNPTITTVKDTKPVSIVTPQITEQQQKTEKPESLSLLSNKEKETSSQTDINSLSAPWTIVVRRSTGTKDTFVEIPTSPPYLTVAQLKDKIEVEADQQIKLIHLGRILQNNYTLVPSSVTATKSDTIKVSNRGVIQAMVYRM